MRKSIIGLLAVFCMAGASASAVTFNFEKDADTFRASAGYEGTFDQVYGANADAIAAGTAGLNTDGGITVSASASNSGLPDINPFMDSGEAGLGVCSAGTRPSGISQCASGIGIAPGDDNLVSPEMLTLTFSDVFRIDELIIRARNHSLISNITDAISINGVLFSTGADGMVDLTGLVASNIYTFTSNPLADPAVYREIYLSSISSVPVPAAGALMVTVLAGLGFVGRRRRHA